MKIALNIERLGARRGGAEKYAGALARQFAAAGHDVHIFAREVDRSELPANVVVRLVPTSNAIGLGWLRAYLFARASERALQAEQFDLIVGFCKVWRQHVYLAVGGTQPATLRYSSRRFRSSLMRGLWWLSKALSPKQWVFRWIARKQFHANYAPRIVAPSRMVAEHFQSDHGVGADRISVVYNALEQLGPAPSAESRETFRRRHGLAPGDVAVLLAAHNYALKGLEPLLAALARVAKKFPTAKLVVCGGSRDGAFRRQAERLRVADRVLFLRFVDDIQACFAGCDVFAFPTFYDPCSLVVLEAMAAGLPVITTRQNGAAELLVEGGDGFTIDSPWALDQLAARLEQLVGDENLRRRMGANARARAEAFAFPVRLAELMAVLTSAAEESPGFPNAKNAA